MIIHDDGFLDGAVLGEELLQLGLGHVRGKSAEENLREDVRTASDSGALRVARLGVDLVEQNSVIRTRKGNF